MSTGTGVPSVQHIDYGISVFTTYSHPTSGMHTWTAGMSITNIPKDYGQKHGTHYPEPC